MRIAFATDNLNVGGTELNAVRTAEALRLRGFDLTVLSLQRDGPLRSRYEAAGVTVRCFPVSNLYGPTAWQAATRMASTLRENRIDVVHAHDIYTNVIAVGVARMVGVPLTIASRRWLQPPGRVYPFANRVMYRAAHRVIANSAALAGVLVEAEGVPCQRVHVIPNFVEPASFEPPASSVLQAWAAELELPPGATVVGCVANLLPIKDHATLLRGMAELIAEGDFGTYLVLVGEGPCRAALERLARELGISGRVRFAGARASQPSFHHLFDISVLTSTAEGSPNSLLEAMAAGRPVVATSVGAVPDLIDSRVGRLVPSSDPRALAHALRELVDARELRVALGAAARARAEMNHSVDSTMNRLVSLYEGGLAAAER